MSNDNTFTTSIEYLPTEIFLQIFAFLPFREIVTAFSGLNFYVDSVIRSVRGIRHVVEYNDDDALKLLHLCSLPITRLVIVNVEMANLMLLDNLRSLTLKYGTERQLDSIRPQHLPMLEILCIKGLHKTTSGNRETLNNLFQVILSNGFPRLRICTALGIGSLSFNNTWTGSPALHTLNLVIETTQDYDRLRTLCPHLRDLTAYDSSMDDTLTVRNSQASRFIRNELRQLERLEQENKFILDVNPMAPFGFNQPPPRFNNTTTTWDHASNGIITIQGRILPKTDPYCRASFLIQMTLPSAYPFKPPEVIFLDPVYHPNIHNIGKPCSCWDYGSFRTWKPKTALSDVIMSIIRFVDGDPSDNIICDYDCVREYQNDYPRFYQKALKCTLTYGRPRE